MFSVNEVVDRLIDKIRCADIDVEPSENIYVEDLFEPAIYQSILAQLPSKDNYEILPHPDAKLPDGGSTRLMFDLTDESIQRLRGENRTFWERMRQVFSSDALKDAILEKFSVRIKQRFKGEIPETVSIPIFYKDFPGYFINVHPDHAIKVATFQVYLPEDNSQIHLGTSFYRQEGNDFIKLKRNQFQPNSGYAFVRTDESWHGVDPIGESERERNTMALTIYIKGSNHKPWQPKI
ncbi:hypothetical protein [Comamonas testosteroni]|uniref:hypothetical protein n=1 Tax=Comamonas testosteroni TaxID=285 RepID=UPI0005B312B3|nr:hypothetical protein [Comamonas testosteroni]